MFIGSELAGVLHGTCLRSWNALVAREIWTGRESSRVLWIRGSGGGLKPAITGRWFASLPGGIVSRRGLPKLAVRRRYRFPIFAIPGRGVAAWERSGGRNRRAANGAGKTVGSRVNCEERLGHCVWSRRVCSWHSGSDAPRSRLGPIANTAMDAGSNSPSLWDIRERSFSTWRSW